MILNVLVSMTHISTMTRQLSSSLYQYCDDTCVEATHWSFEPPSIDFPEIQQCCWRLCKHQMPSSAWSFTSGSWRSDLDLFSDVSLYTGKTKYCKFQASQMLRMPEYFTYLNEMILKVRDNLAQ